ncbi:MAG TPA: GntR family transcriptional regulator [Planctomycetes bacterium]|nr:GntR family transcriptional regulator [Planctomycetota bacterium]
MDLQPVERRSLSDAVFDQLSGEILAGSLAPGDALPSERRLCELLQVNRGAVREGLKRLRQAGLVQIQQGGSTRVLDYRDTGSFDLLAQLLFDAEGSPNLVVARSIVEMRGAIAPDMARRFAERASPEQVAELQATVERLAASEDLDERQLIALELWGALARGSQNIAYQLAYNTLRKTYEEIRGLLLHLLADELNDVAGYRALAQAAAAGEGPLAAERARDLLAKGGAPLLELFARLEEDQ